MHWHSPRPHRLAVTLGLLALGTLAVTTCSENTGPAGLRPGLVALAPRFLSSAAGIVEIARVRLTLTRNADGTLVRDTVVTLSPADSIVDLAVTVQLESLTEEFVLRLALIGPAGDTLFRGGPLTVTATTTGTPTPIDVPLAYVGVGANAARVVILEPDTAVYFGEPATFTAVAYDAGDAPLPGTPVAWRSLDTTRVRVARADSGRVAGGSQRGTARVVAELLTGPADTVRVTAQPVPADLVAESGAGQTGPPDSLLPLPLVARVVAADGLGVLGEWVRFQVTQGGGTVLADSVRADSAGRVSVGFRVGAAGPQAVSATTPRLTGVSALFSATAVVVRATTVAIISGSGQTDTVEATLPQPIVVEARDAAGAPVPNDTVDFVALDGGSLAPSRAVTDAVGRASAVWTLGPVASVQSGQARLPFSGSVAAFQATATPGAPVQLQFATQPGNTTERTPIAPAPTVVPYDRLGNQVLSFVGTMSAAIGANPSGGTLSGTITVNASAGFATFSDLSIDAAGSGYTLVATSTGLSPATSTPFNILPLASRTFTWTAAQNGDWSVASNWTPQIVPGPGDTAVIAIAGTYAVQSGNAAITVDAVRVGGGAPQPTLEVSNFAGASLGVTGDLFVNVNGLVSVTGLLSGPAPFAVVGVMRVQDLATVAGAAPLLVGSPGQLQIQGRATFQSRSIDNQGLLTCSGAPGGLWPRQGAILVNRPTGTLQLTGCVIDNQNEPAVLNEGLITVGASSGSITGPLTNTGFLDLGTGQFSVTSAGSLDHRAGAIVQGNGTLNVSDVPGAVTLAGRLVPGAVGTVGQLQVVGDLPLTPTAAVEIDIPNLTTHDRLNVSGRALLDGTLSVSMLGGYTPSVGDRFPVLTFASRTGDFVAMPVSGLDPSLRFVRQYVADTLYLVTQPAAVAQILFAGDSTGGAIGIFRSDPDASNRVNVTSEGAAFANPRWSPDRTRITYSAGGSFGLTNQLHVISPDGAELAHVTSDTDTSTWFPRYNSTGQHLAFECGNRFAEVDVCVVPNVDGPILSLEGVGNGAGKVFVTDFDQVNRKTGPGAFAWDPQNPDRLAFVRDSLGTSRIYTALFDGSDVQPLSPDFMDVGSGPLQIVGGLDWSPDGTQLAFSAADPQTGIAKLFTIPRTGGDPTQLTFGPDDDGRPLFSPNNSQILFGRNLEAAGYCSLDAWRINTDGSGEVQVTNEAICDFSEDLLGFDWSPDGTEIVITGFDGQGNLLIYAIKNTTTAATYLADRRIAGRGAAGPFVVRDIQPSWRP
ncbi:MAG: hypothetical protein OER21_01945 [Gemmatimonadota bacterium]|nr:hypothetical protein [Gemmatimonadota bacterium]